MNNIAISVENMSKDFKVYYDKAGSLKEKMMFWKRNKSEIKKVLKDDSNLVFDIKRILNKKETEKNGLKLWRL